MAKYAKTNSIFNYKVDFIVDGELVTPDSASITVQKNNGGSTSTTDVDLPVLSEATSAVFQIPAIDNAVTLPQEIRFITVKFIYQDAEYTIDDVYLLRSNLLIPVTKDSVRALVSMTPDELPDNNIDLVYAYGELDSDLENNLDALIAAGTTFLPQIQRAIAARAAFNSCQLIELMLYQSEQADNTLYKRFSKIDFEAIMARLSGLYDEALGIVSEAEVGIPTLFLAVVGTDAVTGEA